MQSLRLILYTFKDALLLESLYHGTHYRICYLPLRSPALSLVLHYSMNELSRLAILPSQIIEDGRILYIIMIEAVAHEEIPENAEIGIIRGSLCIQNGWRIAITWPR